MTTSTPVEVDKAFSIYFAALNQAAQDAVNEAEGAYNTLRDVRKQLGLPVEGPNGITSDLEKAATATVQAARLLDNVTVDVLAGTRKVGYDAALSDFAIEALPGDTERLILSQSAPGFALVPIQSGEGNTVQGFAPIVWAGVAVAVVQAAVVYTVVSESAATLRSVARQRTERTVAETAGTYAKLVQEGKATPEQAQAMTSALYAGSAELTKAAPPPPPPEDTAGGKIKTISDTVKTVAWVGLGAVVLYGVFRVAAAYTATRAPQAAEAR